MASQVQQQHYLDVLGLKQGATLDEIHTAYYLHIERFSHDPTEEELEEQRKVQHAYAVLRRAHEPSEASPKVSANAASGTRKWLAIAVVLAMVGAAALVAMNYSAIRLRLSDVEPGTVVRLKDRTVPYGTVLAFDQAHRFHVGQPVAAYQIRRADTGEIEWLSKRVVVNGLVEVRGAAPAP